MASSFKELVADYSVHLPNLIVLRGRYGSMPLSHQVLLHKVEKHKITGNIRGIAIYLSLFLREYPGIRIPEKAAKIASEAGIMKFKGAIMYPHGDGTYHKFQID